jgi:TetR/AcrR family fatty acid metabolism transcriptional regulator
MVIEGGHKMSKVTRNQPMSRRERLKRERQDRILESAAAVFARKGYHQATIRDIAELADVADGTIYNYYASKRDLLLAMTQHVIADSAGQVLEAYQAEDDRDFLTAILSDRFRFIERNSDFVRATMTEVWTDQRFRSQYFNQVIAPLLHSMEGYLQARIDAGSVRPVNTWVVVRAMAGSFLIFLLLSQPEHIELGTELSLDDIVTELVDFFLLGLRAHSGVEEAAVGWSSAPCH